MKKIWYVVCLMAVTAGFLCAEDAYIPSRSADLMQFSVRTEPMFDIPLFYPVGWSRDGKFAYVEERTLEGIGGTRTDYLILDAVTDEIVFQKREEDLPDGTPGEPDDADTQVPEWSVAVQFTRALGEFGIINGEGTEFKPFPLETGGDTYTCEVMTTPETAEDAFMDEIGSYSVYVYSEEMGRKRITGGDDIHALSMWIAGCFLSPYEPRLLAVIGKESYVFEGTGAFFLFSGCHLGMGFK